MDLSLRSSSGAYASSNQRVLDGGTQHSEVVGGAAASASGGATPAGTASPAGAPVLNPSRISERINALIDNQVAGGQITSDQAGVLRQVLSAPEAGPADDPASVAAPASSDSASAEAGDGPGEATSADVARASPSETLASFIQQLQRSQSRTVGYGSYGGQTTDLTSSRLLDFNT